MTAFSFRGSTALIALSLALAPLPGALSAQETQAPAMPAPAAPPAPSERVAFTRFGLTFDLPAGARVLTDRDAPGARDFEATSMSAPLVGQRYRVRFPAPGLLPEAGDRVAMLATLSQLAGMDMVQDGEPVALGTRQMQVYRGSGTVLGPGGQAVEGQTLYLVAEEPEQDGTRLLIAVFSAGLGGAAAGELEAQFVDSLRPAEDQSEGDGGAEGAGDGASAAPDATQDAVAAADPPPEQEPAPTAAEVEADPLAPLLAIAESLPLPARATPEGWLRHDVFGLSLAAPAEAVVTDRRDRQHAEYSVQLRDAQAGTTIEMGMAPLRAAELSEMGTVPGTPEFLSLIIRGSGLTGALSPRRILLGDRGMYIYVARGERTRGADQGKLEVTVYLVSDAPDAEGNWVLMGATAVGFAPDEANARVGEMIATMAPAPEEAAPEPEAPVIAAPAPADATPAGDDFATIAAAIPDPSGSLPAGWDRIERFGIVIGAPPGLETETDEDARSVSVGGRDRAARTEIETGFMFAGPEQAARFRGVPGTPEFAQTLEGWAQVEVRDAGRLVQLGGREMRLYIASGEREPVSELGNRMTGFYLVSTAPDADGATLVIGGGYRGYAQADAVALIAATVGSLDAAAVEILPGAASIVLPAGTVLADQRRNERSADLYLADAADPDTRRARITAGYLRRDVESQVRRMLHGLDALIESDVGGVPAWIILGTATRSLDDRRIEADEGVPAELVAPRLCVDGVPPFIVAMLAAPGDNARLDALEPGLTLTLPAEAEPCPDSVIAPIRDAVARRSADAAQAAPPAPPAPVTLPAAPEVPTGWERYVRFGLTFAAPRGMRVQRERTDPDRMEYWLQGNDASGQVAREISLRVFTPAALGRMPLSDPDAAGFADMLSGFSDLVVRATDERVRLGDLTLRVFRGEGVHTESNGTIPGRMVYLVAEAPASNGLSPWFALHSVNQTADDDAAFLASFVASLGGNPEIPPQPQGEEAPPPVTQPARPPETPPAAPQVTMPPPPSAPPASTASPEAEAWEAARTLGSTGALLAYLERYPRGLHSGDARAMLRAQGVVPPGERRPEPPRQSPEETAWQQALEQNRMEAYWTYLKAWPEGTHVAEARAMLDRLRPPPPPAYQEPGK